MTDSSPASYATALPHPLPHPHLATESVSSRDRARLSPEVRRRVIFACDCLMVGTLALTTMAQLCVAGQAVAEVAPEALLRALGAVALALSAASLVPRQDRHSKALFCLASLTWAAQSLLAGATTGAAMVLLAGVRQAMAIRPNTEQFLGGRQATFLIFLAAFTLGSIYSWEGPMSLIPLAGSVVGLVTFTYLSGLGLRLGIICTTWVFVPYAIHHGLFEQVLNALLQSAALAGAWWIHRPRVLSASERKT